MAKKVLVFDMDGTIADLYGIENWLELLRSENSAPYAKARPLYNMAWLGSVIQLLKDSGWTVAVTTWGSKEASAAYNDEVAKVKKDWLDKYDFPYDEFNFQVYGTLKRIATKKLGGRQILVDDNARVRDDWAGETIDANKNIIDELMKLYFADKYL